jgi:ADP-ribose pyrophosphatase YjhB (NUDIX family)
MSLRGRQTVVSEKSVRGLKPTHAHSTHEWIEPQLFQRILEVMPIPAVHAIVTDQGKHLLLKRKIAPLLGGWWIPGGRVHKYEALVAAIKREVREETGLECNMIRQLGTITFLIDDIHTISTIFWMEPRDTKVQLNYEHSTYQWIDRLPKHCHPNLREIFAMSP